MLSHEDISVFIKDTMKKGVLQGLRGVFFFFCCSKYLTEGFVIVLLRVTRMDGGSIVMHLPLNWQVFISAFEAHNG